MCECVNKGYPAISETPHKYVQTKWRVVRSFVLMIIATKMYVVDCSGSSCHVYVQCAALGLHLHINQAVGQSSPTRAATYIGQLCSLQQTGAVVDVVASHLDHRETRGGDDRRVRELRFHRQLREAMSLMVMMVDIQGVHADNLLFMRSTVSSWGCQPRFLK